MATIHLCKKQARKRKKKICKESSRRQLHAEQEESGQQRAVEGGGGLVLSEESIKDIVLLEYGQEKKQQLRDKWKDMRGLDWRSDYSKSRPFLTAL